MSDRAPPIAAKWTGAVFEPLPAWRGVCKRHYVPGEVYAMEAHEARSKASHGHEFAFVAEAWKNLSDAQVERWKNPESLRKWALVKAGYCDTKTYVCVSKAAATQLAAAVEDNSPDGVLIVVRDNVVTKYTPHSQSYKAMGRQQFQDSKQSIMDILAIELGVETEDLIRAAA